ncbi:MAG TPA: SDR family oxidoreductase [Candidatus Dormibacteraeota bacterium]|nr:SDR family oxidoreductase [Candidatus Dormibacteraeota bacterium]
MHPDDTDHAELGGNLVLTGATGFVGGALLAEILTTTTARVTCLVRAGDLWEARDRVVSALRPWLGVELAEESLTRVLALPADITLPRLGLSEGTWYDLAESSAHIVHCAATVRFDEPLEVARAVNVGGARRIVELARAAVGLGALKRAVMVSTTFVAGTTPRAFAEHELDIGQAFRNTYERSKFEAEQEVQAAGAGLPICVVRPSIVVGHSDTGQTTAFNVLYVPLRLLLRRPGSATLPVRADATLDTVPVDWVAQVILAVLTSGQDGMAYAAAAGTDAVTAAELAGLAAKVFDIDPPCLLPAAASDEVLLQAAMAWRDRLSARESAALGVYAPYMVRAARFDSWRAERLMLRHGRRQLDSRAVLTRCLEYARATEFGKLRALAPARRRRAAVATQSAVA